MIAEYLRFEPKRSAHYLERIHYNEFKPLPADLQKIKDALLARPVPKEQQ